MFGIEVVAEAVLRPVLGSDQPVFAAVVGSAAKPFDPVVSFDLGVIAVWRSHVDEIVFRAAEEKIEGVVAGVLAGVFDVALDVVERDIPAGADPASLAAGGVTVVGQLDFGRQAVDAGQHLDFVFVTETTGEKIGVESAPGILDRAIRWLDRAEFVAGVEILSEGF